MRYEEPARDSESRGGTRSRREALTLLLGAWSWLPQTLAAAEPGAAVRLAISESLVAGVNINDARAAMVVWINQMMADLNVTVELDPKVFEPTEEILRRARGGLLDSVALNILEYRQIADVLDSREILAGSGDTGTEQYVLLTRRNGGVQQLGNLRGGRLSLLKAPKMCAAPAWLATILDEGQFSPAEQFFGSIATDSKVSRVVLPVFFGQADACLTSKRGFDTMCELNPQVAKEMTAVASSRPMVVSFYIFHKNYRSANRERFVKSLAGVRTSAAGRQLAALFQFEDLAVRDASCLAEALRIIETSERAFGRRGGGSRK